MSSFGVPKVAIGNYRKDIDGLRAVAVLSVLLVHLDISVFKGGYVGVDIFFVISGYLITALLKNEYEREKKIDYLDFYIRRLRRLMPAFLFVVALCSVVSPLLFSPQHLESYGASLIHALTSISNIYFWTDSDYFDLSVEVKPLLHTWSLSVEEQFYLIWPAFISLLVAGGTRWRALIILVVVFCCSLYANFMFYDGYTIFNKLLPDGLKELFSDGRATIFYLTPFRVFEFIFGAILVWIRPCEKKLLNEFFVLIGMLLIFYAIFTFDGDIIFPSYNAIIPCLGAALIIYAGKESAVSIILRNRLMVGIGLISYSLYLVHWPLIVFYKYLQLGVIDNYDRILISLTSFIIAVFMYLYIETPFRKRKTNTIHRKNEIFVFGSALAVLLLVIPAANMWANNGWVWRLDKDVAKLYEQFEDYKTFVNKYAGGSNCPYEYSSEYGPVCETNPRADKHIWIVGDSHGRHLTQGLADIYPYINFKFIKNNCRLNTLDYCYKINENTKKVHAEKKRNIIKLLSSDDAPVVIAQTWIVRTLVYVNVATGVESVFSEQDIQPYVDFVVDEIESVREVLQSEHQQRRVIVVGDVARSGLGEGLSPLDCISKPVTIGYDKCRIRKISEDYSRYAFNKGVEERFKKITRSSVLFINPIEATCDNFICKNYTEDNYPIYMDSSHLSVWGSKYIAAKLYPAFRYAFRDYIENRNFYSEK